MFLLTWASNICALCSLLLLGGYIIYKAANESQTLYEEEFVNRHRDIIDEYQENDAGAQGGAGREIAQFCNSLGEIVIGSKSSFMKFDKEFSQTAQDFIPLTLEQRESKYLLALCGMQRNRWMQEARSGIQEPSIQIKRIRFRRITPTYRPVRIELIRCGVKYALTDAGDGYTGYVLEKDGSEEERDITDPIFAICGKFIHKRHRSKMHLIMKGMRSASNDNFINRN